MAKTVSKWGVTIYCDAVIGPVKFTFKCSVDRSIKEYVDPLSLDNWVHFRSEPGSYSYIPSRLFTSKKNATLFADGARLARQRVIDSLSVIMTDKKDIQAEREE